MIKGVAAELSICLRCQYRLSQARSKTPWKRRRQPQIHARGLKQWPNLLESQASALAEDSNHDNAFEKQDDASDGTRLQMYYSHVDDWQESFRKYKTVDSSQSQVPALAKDPDHDNASEKQDEASHETRLFMYYTHDDGSQEILKKYKPFDGTPLKEVRAEREGRKESLGVKSLGAPAEALVLKKVRRKTPKIHVLASDAGGETASVRSTPAQLVHEVDTAYDVADIDQACANIDRLRRNFFESQNQRQDLGTEEYEDLETRLANGFQKTQLVQYLEQTSPKTTADPSDIHRPFSSKLYARSAWTPTTFSQPKEHHIPHLGTTQEDTPSHLRTRSWKYIAKSALAEAIIKSRWNLRRRQPTSVNGTVFLRVQPAHLRLLLDHPRDPLKHVGEIFHTEIEAFRETGVIRIVSNFAVAKEVLRVLTQLCESIGSRVVRLSSEGGPQSDQALSNEYFLQVATLTNTIIRRNEEPKDTCTVLYLGPETTDLDDVERLLKFRVDSGMGHVGQSKENLLYKPSSEVICMVPVEHRESLPVATRSNTWSRVAHPMSSLDNREASKVPRKNINIMRGPQSAAKRVIDFLLSKPHDPLSTTEKSKHWKNGLSASTSAMLGHVVFQARDFEMFSSSSELEAFLQNEPGTDSVFIPLVPGSMRSFDTCDIAPETLEATDGTGISESLRLRMIPDPENKEPQQPWTTRLPNLDIEVGINRQTGDTTFKWARFIVDDSVMNFMLPMRMLDIQFSRQSYLFNDEENPDPTLLDFVDVSNLDILRSEALRTPNYLHIDIPGHALPEVQGVDRDDRLRMRYAFSNLEYRSSIKLRTTFDKQSRSRILPFSDHHVTFTHVEAGRLGGRREELVVHDLGDLINADSGDLINVSVPDAADGQQPTIDIDHLQDIERTPDGLEWMQKARALGPRGRARRLLKAALAVTGNIDPNQPGGLKI